MQPTHSPQILFALTAGIGFLALTLIGALLVRNPLTNARQFAAFLAGGLALVNLLSITIPAGFTRDSIAVGMIVALPSLLVGYFIAYSLFSWVKRTVRR